MSSMNEKAYLIIDKIDFCFQNLSRKFSDLEQSLAKAHTDLNNKDTLLNECLEKISHLEARLQVSEHEKQGHYQQLENMIAQQTSQLQQADEGSLHEQKDQKTSEKIENLELSLMELEEKVSFWEEKYKTTYRILQTEMVKMDTMQMELDLAQKERDIALKKQSMTPEQKQMLIKLEHESYKINEAIERIDYISNSLKKIFLVQEDNFEKA